MEMNIGYIGTSRGDSTMGDIIGGSLMAGAGVAGATSKTKQKDTSFFDSFEEATTEQLDAGAESGSAASEISNEANISAKETTSVQKNLKQMAMTRQKFIGQIEEKDGLGTISKDDFIAKYNEKFKSTDEILGETKELSESELKEKSAYTEIYEKRFNEKIDIDIHI